jgi:hypothetical protein
MENKMNIKELKTLIENLPDDMLVVTEESHFGYDIVVDVKVIDVETCEYIRDQVYGGDFQDSGDITWETLINSNFGRMLRGKDEKTYFEKFTVLALNPGLYRARDDDEG